MSDTPWAPPGGTAAEQTPATIRGATSPVAVVDRGTSRPPVDVAGYHVAGDMDRQTARDPRGLVPTAWLKLLWLVLQLAVVPVAVVAPAAGVAVAVLTLVTMMVWSGLAAANAARARPETVYSRSPSPLSAATSWLAPIVVFGAAAAAAWFLVERTSVADDLVGDARQDRIVTIVAVITAIPFLVALYRPFSVLGRVTSWVGGARRSWHVFFWLPGLATILASLVQWIFVVTTGMEEDGGRLGFVGTSSIGLFLGLVAFPVLMTLWLGWTAMSATETASRITWERRNFPEGSFDLSDEFVARAAAAAYLASHPEG